MKKNALAIYRFLTAFGFDPLVLLYALRGVPVFLRGLIQFNRQKKNASSAFSAGLLYPCLADRYDTSGVTKGHYFYQDLLIAQKVFENNPVLHVDIGSRVDGFVAHVASFRGIEVLDIRPLESKIPNVHFVQADLMAEIPSSLNDYCDSLSCLHTLEHFGLGRYGDPINPDGYILGLNNLHKILKKQGRLYLSVPIGPQRIEFNAHRVFSAQYMFGLVTEKFTLDAFSYIDDQSILHPRVQWNEDDLRTNFGCHYGCGIFELIKP